MSPSPSSRVGRLGSLEQVAGTLTRMTETEFDIEARMLRGIAGSVVSTGLDDAKLVRLMREIEGRLHGPQTLEEQSSLIADYALASALRAYLAVAREYAS